MIRYPLGHRSQESPPYPLPPRDLGPPRERQKGRDKLHWWPVRLFTPPCRTLRESRCRCRAAGFSCLHMPRGWPWRRPRSSTAGRNLEPYDLSHGGAGIAQIPVSLPGWPPCLTPLPPGRVSRGERMRPAGRHAIRIQQLVFCALVPQPVIVALAAVVL